jgi:dihydropteroate synthase
MGSSSGRVWRCGRFSLALDRCLVMGILNVTPDSFSDGGEHYDAVAALRHGKALALEGADIVDVGGESTRPGSDPVSVVDELARTVPVVEALAQGLDVPLSVDTRRAEVAEACVAAGADIVNDVSGFRDPAMVAVAAGCNAGLVVMHMLGEPKTMQAQPRYDDVVAEVREYLGAQAAMLEAAGVARERIAVDPGLGFGKTTAHNLELLRRLDEIASLGYPVLIGASRKRFIGEVTGVATPSERVHGSTAVAIWSAGHGGDVVRVHDVSATAASLAMLDAIRG